MFKTINRITVALFVLCICMSVPMAAFSTDTDNMMNGFNMMMKGSDMMMKNDEKSMKEGEKMMTAGKDMMMDRKKMMKK